MGEEELAQFERAPQENVILLHDHILDKKILDLDDHEVEVVYDVKLAFQNGKLYAAEVDFSRYRALRRLGLHKLAKLMADRNKEDRVSWLYVQPLPAQLGSFAGSIKLKVPKRVCARSIRWIWQTFWRNSRAVNACRCSTRSTPNRHPTHSKSRATGTAGIDTCHREGTRGDADQRDESRAGPPTSWPFCPRDEAGAILKLIDRGQVVQGRAHHRTARRADSAVCVAELIRLPATTPAAEVLDRYREWRPAKNVVTYVYVTDAAGTLKGVVDLREIVAAEPGQTLGDIMTEHVIALPRMRRCGRP